MRPTGSSLGTIRVGAADNNIWFGWRVGVPGAAIKSLTLSEMLPKVDVLSVANVEVSNTQIVSSGDSEETRLSSPAGRAERRRVPSSGTERAGARLSRRQHRRRRGDSAESVRVREGDQRADHRRAGRRAGVWRSSTSSPRNLRSTSRSRARAIRRRHARRRRPGQARRRRRRPGRLDAGGRQAGRRPARSSRIGCCS